jgi:hypothetical protein
MIDDSRCWSTANTKCSIVNTPAIPRKTPKMNVFITVVLTITALPGDQGQV